MTEILGFLGLTAAGPSDRWGLPVTADICGGRDSIYGGCALAASIEAMERHTGRPTVWATCQFLRPAHVGTTLDLRVEVSAAGRAISHARVLAVTTDGNEAFICLVSAGEREFPNEGIWAQMPAVPGPEGLPGRYIRPANRGGIRRRIVERAVTDHPAGILSSVDGRCQLWMTLPGGVPATAAALALLGDEVSTATSAAFDKDTQAPSLDNTLRVIQPRACDWVLADIELRAAARGFAHGIVNLWSRDGHLLAIATQSGVLRMRGT